MKKAEKTKYLSMPCIAYYSGFNGVEIKDIEYNINEYVIAVSGAWGGNKTMHRVRIYYGANSEPYFKLYGIRIYLYDCIRV